MAAATYFLLVAGALTSIVISVFGLEYYDEYYYDDADYYDVSPTPAICTAGPGYVLFGRKHIEPCDDDAEALEFSKNRPNADIISANTVFYPPAVGIVLFTASQDGKQYCKFTFDAYPPVINNWQCEKKDDKWDHCEVKPTCERVLMKADDGHLQYAKCGDWSYGTDRTPSTTRNNNQEQL
ncbi:unnamed protein product [Meganyctiphanes norvegica]|uniref:Uncharacterized protein n=1 Tax=Meganyctiphanes norvegica TaxID=48144 RepID=A0AAV2S5Z6_MEGNR